MVAGGGAINRHAVALPLIGPRLNSIGVYKGIGGGEHIVDLRMEHAAAGTGEIDNRHRARKNAVEIHDRLRGSTGNCFSDASIIGLRGSHAQPGSHVIVAKRIGIGSSPHDRNSATQPLVAERADAVGIGERADSRELISLPGSRRATQPLSGIAHCERPRHDVVDVENRSRGVRTHQPLRSAEQVSLSHRSCNHAADVSLGKDVTRRGCAGDRHAISTPLVAQGSRTVEIGHMSHSDEPVALFGVAHTSERTGVAHCQRPCHGIVDVADRPCRIADNSLASTKVVCFTGRQRDRSANIGLRQLVIGQRSPLDRHAIPPPLQRNSPRAIDVLQVGRTRQNISLQSRCRSSDWACLIENCHHTRDSIIHVYDGAGCDTAGRLGCSACIGLRHLNTQTRADIALREDIKRSSCVRNGMAVSEPLKAESSKFVVIC